MTSAISNLNLGMIGNGTVSALIDECAAMVWACFPTFDGDPAFCSLLQPKIADSGKFEVVLEGFSHGTQRYLDNSAVLSTQLVANDGSSIEVRDFAPRYKQFGRVFHPMGFVRSVRPLSGTPKVRIRMRPLSGYAERIPERRSGSNHVRYLLGETVLRVTTDAPLSMLLEEVPFLLDREIHFIIGEDEPVTEQPAQLAGQMMRSTLEYWHEWVRYLSIPAEWQDAVIRAAITLKLCQHEGTGAIVAAMTTSIPEAPHTVRNWDYRYCWLRDAAFVVRALNRLGATRSMEEYARYLFNLAASDTALTPVYGIHFERELLESEATALSGYRGMGPVRVGNDAWRQVQHDVHGSVVLAVTQLFFDRRLARPGDAAAFHWLEPAGESAWLAHDQPDAGIWEFRGRESVHTYSSAMCWATCDRLARIAAQLKLVDRAEFWRQRALTIRETILARCIDPKRGHFVDAFDGEHLDASLLLLAELGFVSASDPRYVATVDAIGRELTRSGHLYRYIAPDDFGVPETSFTVCNFWYVDALAATGRTDQARKLFESLLEHRNPLGLLSEDIATETGELWGNYPQTYSMVGLINSAMRLSRSWEELL